MHRIDVSLQHKRFLVAMPCEFPLSNTKNPQYRGRRFINQASRSLLQHSGFVKACWLQILLYTYCYINIALSTHGHFSLLHDSIHDNDFFFSFDAPNDQR
jgi:hypothetical protein